MLKNYIAKALNRRMMPSALLLAALLSGCGASEETTANSNTGDNSIYSQAKALEAEGRYPAAAESYRRFLSSKPSGETKTHAMIKAVVMEESINYGADDLFDRYLLAINQRESGNWQAALVTLDKMLQSDPSHYLADDARYLLAYIQLNDQHAYNVAHQTLGALLELYPDTSYYNTAVFSRGIAQKKLGNTVLATQHFQELQDRHTGLSLDIFNLRWPQDNFVARLWFTRAHEELVALESASRVGIIPTKQEMQNRDLDERANILVIFTDDQGYADLGVSGILGDVHTPNLDQLAADGVRLTSGYATAPQCTPSRAGLLTGRYQQKFGLDDNTNTPMPLTQSTLANRLQDAGYATGMAGKWHLEVDINSKAFDASSMPLAERTPYFPDERGFDDVYFGYTNTWWTNYDLAGKTVPIAYRKNQDYRLDVTTDAGLAFIERHKQEPFFLYMSYYAPHVPLLATEKYLSRHENVANNRRKHALAMISAIDDGVARLRENLADNGLSDNTLIFFISDNGAPLGLHKLDQPIDDHTGIWDGSLNEPWVGEKGMLAEGGIRVPYLVAWPDNLPTNSVLDNAVSTLDVAATSLAVAGIGEVAEMDGENLLPYLRGENFDLENRPLYWRFWNQAAIRKGNWKYLSAGDREYLFDLGNNHEHENLINRHPNIAAQLKTQLGDWSKELYRPGLPPVEGIRGQERAWYDFYIGE